MTRRKFFPYIYCYTSRPKRCNKEPPNRSFLILLYTWIICLHTNICCFRHWQQQECWPHLGLWAKLTGVTQQPTTHRQPHILLIRNWRCRIYEFSSLWISICSCFLFVYSTYFVSFYSIVIWVYLMSTARACCNIQENWWQANLQYWSIWTIPYYPIVP